MDLASRLSASRSRLAAAALLFAAAALAIAPARAGTAEIHARFASRFDAPAQFDVLESPFRGMYLIVDRAASLRHAPLIVDRGVTLLFDGQWHRVTGRNAMVGVPGKQAEALRRRLAQGIAREKFVAIRYGQGRRTIILNQAVDCGWCRRFERNLEAASRSLDATFYFIPGAVNASDPEKIAVAERIYCAKHRAAAWRDWMLRNVAPRSGDCHAGAYRLHIAVADVLFRGRGTPAALLEDGRIIAPGAASSAALEEAFGARSGAAPLRRVRLQEAR